MQKATDKKSVAGSVTVTALFCGNFHYLLAVVVTASVAHLVSDFKFVALRAFHQSGSRSRPVCCSLMLSLFGCFSLLYCHFTAPPLEF